jgi:hypothetical protein
MGCEDGVACQLGPDGLFTVTKSKKKKEEEKPKDTI